MAYFWAFFISFAFFWKASPEQKTIEARKSRNCLLRLTCHIPVFATCAIIAFAAQKQAFSSKKRYRRINGGRLQFRVDCFYVFKEFI